MDTCTHPPDLRPRRGGKKGGGSIGKKRFSAYDSLGEKNLFNAQRCELIRRFDLNKESWLAEEICHRFNQLMDEDEDRDGIQRLKPGELLVSFQGKRVVIPLLTPSVISFLQNTGSFAKAKAMVEKHALAALKQVVPRARLEDLRPIITPRDLLPHI